MAKKGKIYSGLPLAVEDEEQPALFEPPKAKMNFNTILHLVVISLMGLAGYLAKAQLEDIKSGLMPRQEIEVRLKAIETQQTKIDLELISLRADVTKIQIDAASGKRTTP